MLVSIDDKRISITLFQDDYRVLTLGEGFLVQEVAGKRVFVHYDVSGTRSKPKIVQNSSGDLIIWLPIAWLLDRKPPIRLTFPQLEIGDLREILCPASMKAGARAVQGMGEDDGKKPA